MASFTATFSTHPNASVGSCYALTIKDPDPDSRQNEMITAYVGPDFGLTVISKDLALAHTPDGIVREGQEIQLCIQQTEPSTLVMVRFEPFPIRVRFANPRLGSDYLHIAEVDLLRFFDLSYCDELHKGDDDPTPFMLLEACSEFQDRCRQL